MNDLIRSEKFEIDVLDESLYSFDIHNFGSRFFVKSQEILFERISRQLEKSPSFWDFLRSIKPVEALEAQMSHYGEEMYKKGEWFLKYSKTKNGLIPMLTDKSGSFVEQLVLKAKTTSPELVNSLNNLSMQTQLGQLVDQMNTLNNSIHRVELGQRDDRIGLVYSARQQYIEAVSMSNIEFQAQAFLNAARTANDARFQMMQSTRSNIEQIIGNTASKKEKIELSNNVRESMQMINEATELCVITYSTIGETKPMIAALKSYKVFIEQTFLSVRSDGLTTFQKLHQNWHGSDNEWLLMPGKLVKKLDDIILLKLDSKVLVED